MINVNGLKRNAKNIVKKYSDAQVKVREATSNDPWGPSSTIMAEIADLTYNVVAFSEIMQMIWKRLNDHGRNWRHVYKALVVLEYLIKTGSDKVAQQCIENIFAIQTLKDFQYIEENKDHGLNIREKSKKLVSLLKDSEKLQAERARAIKAKSRLAESMSSVGKHSIGSLTSSGGSSGDTAGSSSNNGNSVSSSSYPNFSNDSGSSSSGGLNPDASSLAMHSSDLDAARPQTATEEEIQLKLALALSKEEAEKQENTKKHDELRLKLALDVSKKTANTSAGSGNLLDDSFPSVPSSSKLVSSTTSSNTTNNQFPASTTTSSTIDDLLGLNIPPLNEVVVPNEVHDDPWTVGPSSSTTVSPPAKVLTTSSMVIPSDDPWQTVSSIQPSTTTTTTITSNKPFKDNFSNDLSTLIMPSFSTLTTNNDSQFETTPSTNQASNGTVINGFSKRPMSKNPFED